jgi:hypothetical protein
MVSDLHAVLELDSLSAHVPALALQLVELSGLHLSAPNFGMRLGAAEEALQWFESSLASVERALLKIEDGWKENIKER